MKLVQKIIDKIRKKKKISSAININGKDNVVNRELSGLSIEIYGDNNKILIDESISYFKGHISIGLIDCPSNNCTVTIGANCVCNRCHIRLAEDNSEVIIGNDSLFSDNVKIWATDTHTILDSQDNIINIGKSIIIGSHVWICQDVCILKNTTIPNNSIVGIGSIVTKKFSEENSIIAGNPARVVKRGIKWSDERPQNYLRRQSANN